VDPPVNVTYGEGDDAITVPRWPRVVFGTCRLIAYKSNSIGYRAVLLWHIRLGKPPHEHHVAFRI
jgi:hypothetical protein